MNTTIPGYWMNETSGRLAPVVRKYLTGEELRPAEVETMREYLSQWITLGSFLGSDVQPLRISVGSLTTTAEIRSWLAHAIRAGIDPL